MTFRVRHADGPARTLPGPAELYSLGPSDVVLVVGEIDPAEAARWAAALGLAAMRGVTVRTVKERRAS